MSRPGPRVGYGKRSGSDCASAFIIRSADEDAVKLVLRLARWEAASFLNGE
jgi:hypothetical protein